ncbi:hypothetical protein H0A36_26760 [Endozoicomonas sp. SM1973]|uniref:Uncharacterized protein n=1 Tax=Spartinivicinus marinus TaxID=2994442 RepID=A0A853IHU2_9GAMM|nr:hypothetical protein [Spartinivicinus marinus]MCX4024747.1 hypothetical protein [Spartinivicinus marinus]NYZ69621.1 hypothetical protein [Spartinivicinus marinus]
MCHPAIPAAIAAVTSAYSIHEQGQQAAFQDALAEHNQNRQNKALLEDYKNQNSQLNIQEAEEDDAATEEKIRIKRETQKRIAEARVSSAEAGVSGLSIDSLVSDIIRGGANNVSTIESNLESSAWQRQRERQALWNNARYGLRSHASYKPSKMAKSIGSALQISSAAMGAYSSAGGSFGGS